MEKHEKKISRVKRSIIAASAAVALMGAGACEGDQTVESTNPTSPTTEAIAETSTMPVQEKQHPQAERVRQEVLEPLLVKAQGYYQKDPQAATISKRDDWTYMSFQSPVEDGIVVRVDVTSKAENPLYDDVENIERFDIRTFEPRQGKVTSDNPEGDLTLQHVEIFSAHIEGVLRMDVIGEHYDSGTRKTTYFTSQGDLLGPSSSPDFVYDPLRAIDVATHVTQTIIQM